MIGARIRGRFGHASDIITVFGTMFGVATSLGLGVLQVNAGLQYLFGLPNVVAISGYSRDQVIDDLLARYELHIQVAQTAPA